MIRWTHFVFVAAMALAPAAFPQQSQQRVSGQVVATDGAAVPGASVVLNPGQLRTQTDRRGEFSLPAVAAGQYTLRVTYIGMQASTTGVTVGGGPSAALRVVLHPSGLSQSVTVTANGGQGMQQTINVERSAPNELNSLSQGQIRQLPNANVADALGRLPGMAMERDEGEAKYVEIRGTAPNLSNVTVDGVNLPAPESGLREMKLDVIPADLVSAVQVSKTLQADQNGDGIGGTVNLVTREAPPETHVSLFLNGGRAPIDNGRDMAVGNFTVSARLGPKHRFGIIFTGSDDYNARGIDDVEPVPDLLNNKLWVDAADLRQYLYNRHRYGLGGSVTDDFSKNNDIYFRYLYSRFYDSGLETIYSLNTNQVLDGVNNTNTPSASNAQRIPLYNIGSIILGGDFQSPSSDSWMRWQVSAGQSGTTNPQFSSGASFTYTGGLSNCQFDQAGTSDPYLPVFTPACYTEAYNQNNYVLKRYKDGSGGHTGNTSIAGKFDEGLYYHSGSGIGTFQWGAQVTNNHQLDDSYVVTYKPTTAIPMSLFETNYTNSNYYNGNYIAGPWNSFALAKNYVMNNLNLFTVSSDQGQDSADYSLLSLESAVYAMNTYTAGDATVYAGLRVEQTDVHTRSMNQLVTPNVMDALAGANYLSLLPSASLTYRLNGASDVRVAYFRGISRPEPYQLSSAVSVDETTNPFTYSLGNTALQPEFASDFDLMYERYFSTVGTFRASYFYKYLTNPIVSLQTIPNSGQYAGFRVDEPANAGHAWVDGIELEFQQQFHDLPGALSGLALNANYTWTASRAFDVNPAFPGNTGRSDNPALLRQTPETFNLTPTFNAGPFFLSYGLSYNGSALYQYNYQDGALGGINGPNGDVYSYPHLEMDGQASVRLLPSVTLVLADLNMNNEAFGFYQGATQYDIQREYYSPTYEIGLRFTWPRE